MAIDGAPVMVTCPTVGGCPLYFGSHFFEIKSSKLLFVASRSSTYLPGGMHASTTCSWMLSASHDISGTSSSIS
jgi:hypothetical protein